MRCSLNERRLRAAAVLLDDDDVDVVLVAAGGAGKWLFKLLVDDNELSEIRAMDSVEPGKSVGDREVVDKFRGEQRRLRLLEFLRSISLLLISGKS